MNNIDDREIHLTLQRLPICDVIAKQTPTSIILTHIDNSTKVAAAIHKPTCNITGYKQDGARIYEAYGYRISFSYPARDIICKQQQNSMIAGISGHVHNLHLNFYEYRRFTEVYKVYVIATHESFNDKLITYNLHIELLRFDE